MRCDKTVGQCTSCEACTESCSGCGSGYTCAGGVCQPACNNNGICDTGETVSNCPRDCCNSDCTAGSPSDGICHTECNTINGCSISTGCGGQMIGAVACGDTLSLVTCCSGQLVPCGTDTICNPSCSGNQLYSYPSGPVTCNKICISGACNCNTQCGTGTTRDCGKTAYCSGQSCVDCPAGSGNCDQDPSNSCEVNLMMNGSNCGSCGNACGSNQICQSGACISKTNCSSNGDCTSVPGQYCCSGTCKTPACSNCNDGNPCTDDYCQGTDPCTAVCAHNKLSGTSCPGGTCQDGVCIPAAPGSCTSDANCSGQKCCGGACKTPACTSADDNVCNKGVGCMQYSCSNPNTCNAACSETKTTQCSGTTKDGCCPDECKYENDVDCPKDCGNGKCDTAQGENYCSCPEDCSAQATLGDVPGETCKQYACSGKTRVETAKPNCCGNNECESIMGEGCGTCPHDCSCPAGQTCRNNRCTYENLLENGAECTSASQCKSDYCENGYCCAAGDCCRKKTDCLQGQVCSNFSCQFPDIKCSDATVGGQCSKNRPMYCNNGVLVTACATCGCQEGSICTLNGICNIPQCSDGTYFNNCSANKPNMCKEGMLISSCFKCGCPEGLLCDNTSQTCYEKPVIKVLSPLENGTINIGVERSVVISGVILKSPKVSLSIEGNDSKFILTKYDASTGEFTFENSTPVSEGPSSLAIRVADSAGNLLNNESRHFRVIYAPAGMTDLASLQGIGWYVVQFALIAFFSVILINVVRPVLAEMRRGSVSFPDGAIILVEGAVGSGKEELCLQAVRSYVSKEKFGVIFSYEPEKVEGWFRNSEKSKLIFVKVEPDINTIAWSISRAMTAAPSEAFFDVLNMLAPKYNAEELTDFLSTNFSKLRNAKCGAMFCIDKGTDEKTLSAIEGLFDGVVEFKLQEEKGKLNSYFRVKEFKLKKMDTNWRRFK